MKPGAFAYVRAESLDHATSLLADNPSGAKLIAGGQSLLPSMNMRQAAPELLIDIGDLEELRGIAIEHDHLRIGAGTRHVELETSELVARHAPLFTAAIGHVAHAAVRNRGTVGGNLAFAHPASELPACCVASGAEFDLAGRSGARTVAARAFFLDAYSTVRRDDELLTAIRIPLAGANTRTVFREFAHRRGAVAVAGLALQAEWNSDRFSALSPVFFALANTPLLAAATAAPLIGVKLTEANIERAVGALAAEVHPVGDMHASQAFKLHLARHFFADALRELHGGARA
jgi:carbon-monoxide dehydrogenase medium subunit